MATYSTIIDKANRSYKLDGGLEVRIAEITVGTASNDYSSGIAVSGAAAKMGLRYVAGAAFVGARSSDNAGLPLGGYYHAPTGKIRMTIGSAEIAASDIGDGAKVRLIVFGA